jgi:hypothetical protein
VATITVYIGSHTSVECGERGTGSWGRDLNRDVCWDGLDQDIVDILRMKAGEDVPDDDAVL